MGGPHPGEGEVDIVPTVADELPAVAGSVSGSVLAPERVGTVLVPGRELGASEQCGSPVGLVARRLPGGRPPLADAVLILRHAYDYLWWRGLLEGLAQRGVPF